MLCPYPKLPIGALNVIVPRRIVRFMVTMSGT